MRQITTKLHRQNFSIKTSELCGKSLAHEHYKKVKILKCIVRAKTSMKIVKWSYHKKIHKKEIFYSDKTYFVLLSSSVHFLLRIETKTSRAIE